MYCPDKTQHSLYFFPSQNCPENPSFSLRFEILLADPRTLKHAQQFECTVPCCQSYLLKVALTDHIAGVYIIQTEIEVLNGYPGYHLAKCLAYALSMRSCASRGSSNVIRQIQFVATVPFAVVCRQYSCKGLRTTVNVCTPEYGFGAKKLPGTCHGSYSL